MSETETLGCRHYLAEEEIFAAAGELQRSLHTLEERIRTLASDIHGLLCESGSVPGDTKAVQILDWIRSTFATLDLAPVEAQVRRVAELKAQVDELEHQLAATGLKEPRLRAVA